MIKILLPVLAASLIYAGDYEDAKRYLNGELGVKIITKRMPNCPYEKCDEVADRDGLRTFHYKTKDFKTAIILLRKSIRTGNTEASSETIKLLKQYLNYKDTKPDSFLLKKCNDELGLGLSEYRQLFLEAASVLKTASKCEGYFTLAEITELGLLGKERDIDTAKNFYAGAVKNCPNSSFESQISIQKLKGIR